MSQSHEACTRSEAGQTSLFTAAKIREPTDLALCKLLLLVDKSLLVPFCEHLNQVNHDVRNDPRVSAYRNIVLCLGWIRDIVRVFDRR